MGEQKEMAFTTKLASVKDDGGIVPAVDLRVIRKFPVIFMETLPCGKKQFRNERADSLRSLEISVGADLSFFRTEAFLISAPCSGTTKHGCRVG